MIECLLGFGVFPCLMANGIVQEAPAAPAYYQCLPYDPRCEILPPQGWRLPPLPEQPYYAIPPYAPRRSHVVPRPRVAPRREGRVEPPPVEDAPPPVEAAPVTPEGKKPTTGDYFNPPALQPKTHPYLQR